MDWAAAEAEPEVMACTRIDSATTQCFDFMFLLPCDKSRCRRRFRILYPTSESRRVEQPAERRLFFASYMGDTVGLFKCRKTRLESAL